MSKHEWKPGDVAIVDGPGARLPITFFENEDTSELMFNNGKGYQHPVRHLAKSARPLMALDPEDMQQVKSLIRALHRVDVLDPSWDEDTTRNKVTRALRSLIAPPKPAEPLNVGSIITDNDGELWARHGNGMWSCLQSPPGKDFATWDDLVGKYGPVLLGKYWPVSEGVQS